MNNYELPKNINLNSITLVYWENIIHNKKIQLNNLLKRDLKNPTKTIYYINLNKNFFNTLYTNLISNKILIIIIIISILRRLLIPYFILRQIKKLYRILKDKYY